MGRYFKLYQTLKKAEQENGGKQGVKSLSLRSLALTDLDFIKDYPNLQHLDLYNNALTSIESLYGLKNLEQLSIAFNKVTNIDRVYKFSKLQWFSLDANPIEDLTPILNLPKTCKIIINSNNHFTLNDINYPFLIKIKTLFNIKTL